MESIFGYWFKEYNFGIHMRKHRNQSENYEIILNNQKYKFTYKRNFYGFRGEEIKDLSDIKYVFLGGSTGNERLLPEELTIVGKINSKFKKNNFNKIYIYNASVDGKSLRGHKNDFEFWFTKLKNFQPNYFIIYAGINDTYLGDEIKYDLTFNKRNYKQFLDLISNNSITIELIKKIKWKFFNSVKQKYDIDNLNNIYNENYEYINYKYAKKIYNTDNLKNKYSYLYKRYKKRLEDIYIKSKDFNSKIIFITQIKFDGLRDEKLFLLNEITKEFSKEKQIKIIKLDEKFAGEINDFYDQNHPTEKGSDKISEIVYTELLKIIFY
tara:strand:+ start:1238 stop:2209 length:972 start_codon:yes stop_codon:yes gene_type:complete